MPAPVCDDAGLVEFAEPASLRPFLDAAGAVARDAAAARDPTRTAGLVRGLGLTEVIEEMRPLEAATLVFHVARIVAQADAAGAWLGLHDAPSVLLGFGHPAAVALPTAAAGTWVVSLSAAAATHDVWVADPRAGRLRSAANEGLLAHAGSQGLPLAALPGARQLLLRTAELAAIPACAERPLHPELWQAFLHGQGALLGGLVAGACRRLVQEAFAYAQQRQSAGKPIAQYQAVALRLAEIAMQHEAMAMYLACVAEGVMAAPGQALARHVSGTARGIARDAVQTAAAHGYVEGLAFKRLYEQVHVLCALLDAWGGQSSMFPAFPAEST